MHLRKKKKKEIESYFHTEGEMSSSQQGYEDDMRFLLIP